jgi:hypothetical protein
MESGATADCGGPIASLEYLYLSALVLVGGLALDGLAQNQ